MGFVDWEVEPIFFIDTPREFVKSILDAIEPKKRYKGYTVAISSHDSRQIGKAAGIMQTGTGELLFHSQPGSFDGNILILASRSLTGVGKWSTSPSGPAVPFRLTIIEFAGIAEPVITLSSDGKSGKLQNQRFEYGVLSGYAAGTLNRVVAFSLRVHFNFQLPRDLHDGPREEGPGPGPLSELAE